MLAVSMNLDNQSDQGELKADEEDEEEEPEDEEADGDRKANSSQEKTLEICNADKTSHLKSLLKKTNNKESLKCNHNRTVTFNQTVIVFCEELDSQDESSPTPPTTSPSDLFEPPLGYQDNSNNNNNNNNNNKTSHGLDSDKGRRNEYLHRFGQDDGDADDDDDIDERPGNYVTRTRVEGSNGLEDNFESSRKLSSFKGNKNSQKYNYDVDYLEFDYNELDEYHLKQHLNSNSSYLCSAAISDCESDTESTTTTCLERIADNNGKSARGCPARNDSSKLNQQYLSNDQPSTKTNSIKSNNNNKSTSARVKVSTIDKVQLQRRESSKKQNDLNNTGSKQKQSSEPTNRATSREEPKQDVSTSTKPCSQPVDPQQSSVGGKVTTGSKQPITSGVIINSRAPESIQNQRDLYPSVGKNDQTINAIGKSQLNHHPILRASGNLDDHNLEMVGPSTITNPVSSKPPSAPQKVSCDVCKVIESSNDQLKHPILVSNQAAQINHQRNDSTSQAQLVVRQHHVLDPKNPSNKIWVSQPTATTTAAAASFDPSCVSCREVLLNKTTNLTTNSQQLSQLPTTVAVANTAPLGLGRQYQIIHVVDQNGNRLKTLSVLRPATLQQSNAGGRILISTQNNGRFPTPITSASGQQPHRIISLNPNNGLAKLINGQSMNTTTTGTPANNNQTGDLQQKAHQLKLISLPNNQEQMNSNYQIKDRNLIPTSHHQISSSSNRPNLIYTNDVLARANLNIGHHTVYYLRQPLHPTTTQNGNTNLSGGRSNTTSTRSSFPDPHEVRRLDGLKGPPTNQLNLSTSNHRTITRMNSALNAPTSDAPDDPTFGFSNRPSVKVVATKQSKAQHLNHNPNQDKPVNSTKPVTSIAIGSETQTLDRRIHQQHQQAVKENVMPSTSSMSNIYGSMFAGNRVSSNVASPEESKTKGKLNPENLQRWLKHKLTISKSHPTPEPAY